MINAKLLSKLREKHPEYTKAQINLVLCRRIALINYKLTHSNILDIKIRKLGRLHTHGNKKNFSKLNKNERVRKFISKSRDYSDNNLLF